MRYRFIIADVFTDTAYGGNPLAVLPDARGLEGGQMQAIAREFNLSEAVFVLPPEKAAHTRRLRIFTPASEIPVCRSSDGRHRTRAGVAGRDRARRYAHRHHLRGGCRPGAGRD
jgi:PhzF family phenazine biosynthesis protein